MKSGQTARLGPCRASFGKMSLFRKLDLKIVALENAQNARFWPCGGSLEKISPLNTPDLKIVVVASNHLQVGNTVRFL